MQYGHFDDANKEYVITRPDTPRSWSNYLGSTRYGAIISNNAAGYSFFRSAGLGRFMRLMLNAIPMDQPGRYFYLRDRVSGDYWSSSWQPVGKDLETYSSTCRHGTAYTVITSSYGGIETESTYFVPLGKDYECWMLKVTNASDAARKLSVFNFLEYTSNWAYQQDLNNLQYSQYIVKMDVVDGIIRHAVNDNLPPDPDDFTNNDQGRWTFMGLVGAEAAGFDTDREAFIGPYRSYGNPIVVEQGKCTGSLAHGDNACGSYQVDLDLEPGESRELMVVVGVGKAEQEGKEVLAEMDSLDKARDELEKVKLHWHGQIGNFVVDSPDSDLDSMVNVWNAYNCLITYAWSRAASLVYLGERDGFGYRDTVQDINAVLPVIPEEARDRIELMLTGQASTGGAMPVVRPYYHKPGQMPAPDESDYRSDDCMWLFNTVPGYVKETGDLSFYEEVLPFADVGQGTVLEHLRRAIEFNLARTGEHGLPCGLLADWNDCIEFGPKGESVFVALQLRLALATYHDISTRLAKADEAAWAREQLEDLDRKIHHFAWDGRWFRRGTKADGSLIGAEGDDEGFIFLNPQSWSVISGAADDEQAISAMDSVHEHLATEYGIMVCTPPFEKASVETIRAVLMNGGMKENGGIFSHTQGWAVMAEAMLGRGDRAYEYYRAYMPAAQNDRAEIREIEPYVHCQSTHSKFSRRFGASRIPWLSGTASWSYVAGTQYILGIKPDYEGLRVDPCIPSDWEGFSVRRKFRNAWYDITVRNPSGVCGGVRKMLVGGQEVEGNLIPPVAEGSEVKVEIELEG
jgi:cellobiose phosphorylase